MVIKQEKRVAWKKARKKDGRGLWRLDCSGNTVHDIKGRSNTCVSLEPKVTHPRSLGLISDNHSLYMRLEKETFRH